MAAAAAGPAERSQAGLFIARATFHVTLHPARTLNVEDACRDELTSRLMRCVLQPTRWLRSSRRG